MASQKISSLTAGTALTEDDLLVFVDDPAGTPASKKISAANARHSIVGGAALNYPNAGNASFKRGFSGNTASGAVDIYTCPSGKRALIGEIDVYNPTVGAINITPKATISSSLLLLSAIQSVSAGARLFGNNGGFGAPLCLAAGDKLSVLTSAIGLNVSFFVMEIPDTSNVRGIVVKDLANGDNTVYTCPSGKQAYLYNPISAGLITRSPRLLVANESGSSRNYTPYFVPSGGTIGTTTQTSPATAIANAASANFNIDSFFEAGDALVVNTNNGTAGQNVFMVVCEFTL